VSHPAGFEKESGAPTPTLFCVGPAMEGGAAEGTKFTFAQVDNSPIERAFDGNLILDSKRKELAAANKAGNRAHATTLAADLKRYFEEAEASKQMAYGTFDENGVLYHIATEGKTKEYENPHDSGEIRVVRSSVGGGEERDFVAPPAGPAAACSTGSLPGEWIEIDLGPGRRLVLDHYSLRNDNSYGHGKLAPRNWELQAAEHGMVMPAPAVAPFKCRVGKHVHYCKGKPSMAEYKVFEQQQHKGRTWIPHTAEQLAGDIFNDKLKDTTKQQPVQQLAACSREQVLTHFRNHHVELYWQNCISRELGTPFWHTLRKHVNDESLGTQPWSVASWPIEPSPVAETGYRFFRLKATGVNASSNNRRLAVSGVELYGTLFEVAEGIPPPGSSSRFSAGGAFSAGFSGVGDAQHTRGSASTRKALGGGGGGGGGSGGGGSSLSQRVDNPLTSSADAED
jgi:hypothetical protein